MSTQRSQHLPRLLSNVEALRHAVAEARRSGAVVGLVPTMGALHAGHLSLVQAAGRQCGLTVVTVFVNPTQFGPGEDFDRYPRTLEADLVMLAGVGHPLVFSPTTDQMFPPGHATRVEVGGPALSLEGQFRPGHFQGVATVVLKLFNLVMPERAYFGQKDYQQSLVVRQMTRDLDLPIEVVVCPTVREEDGLALSSRNRYLSDHERQRALAISRSVRLAARLVAEGTRDTSTILARMRALLEQSQLQIDYVQVADRQTLEPLRAVDRPAVALVAARVGNTRLIDNELIG